MSSLIRFLKANPWIVGVVACVAVWLAVVHWGWVGRTLLASPSEVWRAFRVSLTDKSPTAISRQALETFSRAFVGWCIGVGAGIVGGLALGRLSFLYFSVEPLIEFFRAIPPILAFPLLLVAFNYTDSAYVWTVVFGCFPVMVLTVARGTQEVSQQRFQILDIYGVRTTIKILATAMEILPSVFLGMRITFSLSLVIAVVTEMVITPHSGRALGAVARDAEISFNTPLFYLAVLFIGVYGFLVNAMFRRLEFWLGGAEHFSTSRQTPSG